MKNHFVFPWVGNKRCEVELLYDSCKHLLKGKKYIIEPYAGTSSFSYYIHTLHPKKYVYYINDNDNLLIELYKILKSKKKTEEFLKKVNEMITDLDKEKYYKIIRDKNTGVYGMFIKNKIHSIRAGLWNPKYKYKPIELNNCGIINFLRTEKIILSCEDGCDIVESWYDYDDAFIFSDPPYIFRCNDAYGKLATKRNIYKFLHDIEGNSCDIVMTIASHWIVDLIFFNRERIEYLKKYTGFNKCTEKTYIFIF